MWDKIVLYRYIWTHFTSISDVCSSAWTSHTGVHETEQGDTQQMFYRTLLYCGFSAFPVTCCFFVFSTDPMTFHKCSTSVAKSNKIGPLEKWNWSLDCVSGFFKIQNSGWWLTVESLGHLKASLKWSGFTIDLSLLSEHHQAWNLIGETWSLNTTHLKK